MNKKKIVLIISILFGLILICCASLSLIVFKNINKQQNEMSSDTRAICEDEEFIDEIRNQACEDLKEDGARDLFSIDIIANKYKVEDLLIYRRSFPGPLQAPSSEKLYIQYRDEYIGEVSLDTQDWNHGIYYGDRAKLIIDSNDEKILFFFEVADNEVRENFQVFELAKESKRLFYYDITSLYTENFMTASELRTDTHEISFLDSENEIITKQLPKYKYFSFQRSEYNSEYEGFFTFEYDFNRDGVEDLFTYSDGAYTSANIYLCSQIYGRCTFTSYYLNKNVTLEGDTWIFNDEIGNIDEVSIEEFQNIKLK